MRASPGGRAGSASTGRPVLSRRARACSSRAGGTRSTAPAGAVLRVPPALLEQARARLDSTGLPVEADPALPPGDARIAWRGGGLALVLAERRAAIREAMASLGFTDEEIPS